MKIICVLHEDQRILDITRDGEYYTIREWEGGQRQEIRLSEREASRIVQVLMELQQDRRVHEKRLESDVQQLEPVGPFGDRY